VSLTTAARPSWAEERRLDRAERARLDRERDDARAERARLDREADQRLREQAADDRRARRAEAADARAARLAAAGDWVNRHVTDLLLAPVIVVPGALSWTAMAAYGTALYGPVGLALPAFSEGGLWAFAGAVTVTRHRNARRLAADPAARLAPVWHLQLGIAVFAVFGAVLNFIHGLSLAGPLAGAAMAVISVAGVTAHQITKAGPRRARRTRADRLARLAERRVRKARRDAVKNATAEVDEHGGARLVFTPTETPAPLAPDEAEVLRAEFADQIAAAVESVDTAVTGIAASLASAIDGLRDTLRAEMAAARQPGTAQAPDTAAFIARLRASKPDLTDKEIADLLGISPRTVRRYPAAGQQATPATA
jgi:DNA-binding CsgD family transcriptional regulator